MEKGGSTGKRGVQTHVLGKQINLVKLNFDVTGTDFPKTVGPDRQKCSRNDDFKIYIKPNVRENCLNPCARKQVCFLCHVCLLYFYYLICGELVFWHGLIKYRYRIEIVSRNTYRLMDRKRKYCDASVLI